MSSLSCRFFTVNHLVLGYLIVSFSFVLVSCQNHSDTPAKTAETNMPEQNRRGLPMLPYNPRYYASPYAEEPPLIDGILDGPSWEKAPWTVDFKDIEGDLKPSPYYKTRAKMMWDSTYFYVGAWMEEPHIRGLLKERDTIIFKDNDFEIFLEDDGDTHNYFEIEINTLGTIFDLMLVKPYRDGGPVIIAWDAAKMKSAVHLFGTNNNPTDIDSAWTVEFAIPWEHFGGRRKMPKENDIWRVNFSRVEYDTDIIQNRYHNRVSEETGKPLPENNWVWSPQGVINMHYPELWGYVQFYKSTPPTKFDLPETEKGKWALRVLYYNQKTYYSQHHRFSNDPKEIGADTIAFFAQHGMPEFYNAPESYHIRSLMKDSTFINITQDGRAWVGK